MRQLGLCRWHRLSGFKRRPTEATVELSPIAQPHHHFLAPKQPLVKAQRIIERRGLWGSRSSSKSAHARTAPLRPAASVHPTAREPRCDELLFHRENRCRRSNHMEAVRSQLAASPQPGTLLHPTQVRIQARIRGSPVRRTAHLRRRRLDEPNPRSHRSAPRHRR